MTIRPLPVIVFAVLALFPSAAGAQGRGGRGGGGVGNRGGQPNQPAPARNVQPQQRGQRGGGQVRRQTDIIILPPLGYYGPAYANSFGLTTGIYPLGDWPAPVVASPFISASTVSNRADESALQAEVGRLSRELDQLRAQTARPLPAAVAPPPAGGTVPAVVYVPPPPQAVAPPVSERIAPSTLLVLRDGRRIETRNYAIVGDTFMILDEGKLQRIPIVDIDRDASEKESRGNGVRFPLPSK